MARHWESIAPIIPFTALPNHVHQVGKGVILDAVPKWFQDERKFAEPNFGKRDAFSAEACLKVTFEADGLGVLVPSVPGGIERPNHEASLELIRIANLALWLARPSSLHLEIAITAEPRPSPSGSPVDSTIVDSICPLEQYAEATLQVKHLATADELATAIQNLSYPSAVWTAIRFLWLALTQQTWEIRFVCLWIAIEALFGPNNGKNIGRSLRTRIACFLNENQEDAKIAFHYCPAISRAVSVG